MKRKKLIIYLYNRFNDPLVQSNLWLYIDKLSIEFRDKYSFMLITYEDEAFKLSPEENVKINQELNQRNIEWIKFIWHPGKSIIKKLPDFIFGFYTIFRLRIFKGYRAIISLGTIAGSFAYLYSVFLGLKLYLYQYEPHSEYTLDVGYWEKSSWGYRILNKLERLSVNKAKVISSGTKHMEQRLKAWNFKGSFFKIPSVVNQTKFQYSESNSHYIRKKYGIACDKKVILYAGKFAGLYFNEENPRMFSYLRELSKDFHILIVTLNPIKEIKDLFKAEGVTEDLTVTTSSYEDIDKYLSAADFGIVSVESGPSKKFVSNIKVGEYLSCGLPYLICRGISEDDWYAEEYNVGVVVKDFTKDEIVKAYPKIDSFLNEEREVLKNRCRKVGVEYRGFSNLYPRFCKAVETLSQP